LTFPNGAQSWAGFANMNGALYPITLKDKKLRFKASVPEGGSADVRFRFEFKPYPDVNPTYDADSITVSGDTHKEYSINLPNQGSKTFSSLILFIVTQDVGVTITDVEIVDRPSNSSTPTTQTTTTASKVAEFSEAFGGATIADSVFTVPNGAQSWAGFANMNTALYPITIGTDKKLTFKASVPEGGPADVRFRFEFKPYPNVNPAYDADSITITGDTHKKYSIELPSQGSKTFSSLILYIVTRDVGVTITDVKIE